MNRQLELTTTLPNMFTVLNGMFSREAKIDTNFTPIETDNRNYFKKLETGLALTAFINLIETTHTIESFKGTLPQKYSKLFDTLKIMRNAFIHGNWDVSKLNKGQQKKFKDYIQKEEFKELGFPENVYISLIEEEIIVEGLRAICLEILRHSTVYKEFYQKNDNKTL